MNGLRQDFVGTLGNDIRIGLHTTTINALVPTGVKFERGDLVVIDEATNTISHPTSPTGFSAIVTCDISAEQATAHATNGTEVPLYNTGTFNPFECKLDGTKLDKANRLAARAYANKNLKGLAFHMPHGVADV